MEDDTRHSTEEKIKQALIEEGVEKELGEIDFEEAASRINEKMQENFERIFGKF